MPLSIPVYKILIQLSVNETQTLYLMISDSGAINRRGDGRLNEEIPQLCMGHTEEGIFDMAASLFREEWLEMSGRYTFPEPEGDLCQLTIILEGEEETGFEFKYGSLSAGPPEDIIDWVEDVVHLTDSWWENQLSKRQRNRRKR